LTQYRSKHPRLSEEGKSKISREAHSDKTDSFLVVLVKCSTIGTNPVCKGTGAMLSEDRKFFPYACSKKASGDISITEFCTIFSKKRKKVYRETSFYKSI
jgi:hypothetical protein